MQPPHQHQRINLAELKALIVKKLGPERSSQYFTYLNRFLNLKLNKVEFNKLCLQIIGRENVPLHNKFIHSILKNACSAKVPPQTHNNEVLKSVRAIGNKEAPHAAHKQSEPHRSVVSNGEILSLSTPKVKTGTHDRKILDHPGPFGSNGKTNYGLDQSLTAHDNNAKSVLENGDLIPHNIQRSLQHHKGIKEQANYEEFSRHQSGTSSVYARLPDGSISVSSKDKIEAVGFENRKEAVPRSLLHAPLGLPYCPVSVGGTHRTIPLASDSKSAVSFNFGGLLDTATLRERMEQIAVTHGLEGVSMDCANLLNNGLDTYLKGLIASCVKLVGARSGHESMMGSGHKHEANLKFANGVRLNPHHNMQSSSGPIDGFQERRPHCSTSLLDFRVAMELNPGQLGEDWPLQLEKICIHAYNE
ncbi:hypothetical protein NMG60_11004762 [Bertholletia excelsa]